MCGKTSGTAWTIMDLSITLKLNCMIPLIVRIWPILKPLKTNGNVKNAWQLFLTINLCSFVRNKPIHIETLRESVKHSYLLSYLFSLWEDEWRWWVDPVLLRMVMNVLLLIGIIKSTCNTLWMGNGDTVINARNLPMPNVRLSKIRFSSGNSSILFLLNELWYVSFYPIYLK